MVVELEDHLSEIGQSWSEFCQSPYEAIQELKQLGAIYCRSKAGYFIFDRSTIERCLFDDGALFQKKVPADVVNEPSARDFFSRWLFYADDLGEADLKREGFKALNRHCLSLLGHPLWHDLDKVPVEDLFDACRFRLFTSLVSIFFDLADLEPERLYQGAETIFRLLQDGRRVTPEKVSDAIAQFEDLYEESKTWPFSQAFFESVTLNCIVDGYEPLSDAVWNTVSILFAQGSGADAALAYQIAINSTPSFRYAVRHASTGFSAGAVDVPAGSKVYCFLSIRTHSESGRTLSFGAGPHVCLGRHLADVIVPDLARRIFSLLRDRGAVHLKLVRSSSLGAEGIEKVELTTDAPGFGQRI